MDRLTKDEVDEIRNNGSAAIERFTRGTLLAFLGYVAPMVRGFYVARKDAESVAYKAKLDSMIEEFLGIRNESERLAEELGVKNLNDTNAPEYSAKVSKLTKELYEQLSLAIPEGYKLSVLYCIADRDAFYGINTDAELADCPPVLKPRMRVYTTYEEFMAGLDEAIERAQKRGEKIGA